MPRFAGGGSRPAGMLTVRAVATATGAGAPGRFWPCPRRPGSLEVTVVVGTLHRIAGSEGPGSQSRKPDLLAGRRQSVPNR